MLNELLGSLNNAGKEIEQSPVSSEHLAQLISKIQSAEISGKIAKTVFEEMFSSGEPPEKIIKDKGLVQISDEGQLQSVIDKVIAANADQVAKYKAGKTKLLGFFVGQVMKATQGKANPQQVNELIRAKL